MAGKPGCGGKKGRSGRKSLTNEQRKSRVIDKAWKLVEDIFDNPKLSVILKAELAKSIVTKNIPQQLEGKINTFLAIAQKAEEEQIECINGSTDKCNRIEMVEVTDRPAL